MEFDIIIIGAGPAGITLASHLSKKLNVALIEKGTEKYSSKINTNDHGNCNDYGNYPYKNYSSSFSSISSIGGNSMVWSGWSIPLQKDEVKNWPINYSELKEYYLKAEKFLDFKNFENLKKKNNKIYKDFLNNNWEVNSWQFIKKKNFNHFISKLDTNVKIFSETEFVKFRINEKKINEIIVKDNKKKEFSLIGKIIVLAQGALQSTKTLLLTEKVHGIKMGNENGHLGKFYMEHPHLHLGYFYDKKKILKKRFTKKNFELTGLYLKKPYKNDLLNGCLTFNNESLLLNPDTLRLQYILRLKKIPKNIFKDYSLIKFFYNLMIGFFNLIKEKILDKKFIYARFEQSPNINSRMELDDNNKIKLNWKISKSDIVSFCKITSMAKNYVKEKISNQVFIDKTIYDKKNWNKNFENKILGIGHHMGTTMMSKNSHFGVVDENLKLHYKDNIFVCSSSVFPSGGVGHPTFTICSLAIRLADHLNNNLKKI
tara:strand:+ start:463 stop:1917 length:1455 start_codon:yes stop_codon:yes gene_type:complete